MHFFPVWTGRRAFFAAQVIWQGFVLVALVASAGCSAQGAAIWKDLHHYLSSVAYSWFYSNPEEITRKDLLEDQSRALVGACVFLSKYRIMSTQQENHLPFNWCSSMCSCCPKDHCSKVWWSLKMDETEDEEKL